MKKVNGIIFGIILILSVAIRIWGLNSTPPALNWDEVSIGYNAYSILNTGKDEWGISFPISFRAYGDYKLPGYIYSVVPFVALFGLNEWSIRLLSALSGVGTVASIFMILRLLTKSNRTSVVGMMIAALTPWLIIMSRIALEANLALFLLTLSMYLFIKGLRREKYLIFSVLTLAIAMFTYNSVRVIALPLVLLCILIYKKELLGVSKLKMLTGLLLVLLMVVVYLLAIFGDSAARFKWTTILDSGAILRINELRGSSGLSAPLNTLRYNKATYLIPKVLTNYISHFSPNFLFINGGSQYQYSVPGNGLISWVLLPLWIFGLAGVFKERQRWQLLILGWVIISPLGGAITRDAPHALRSLFLVVPLTLFAGLGFGYMTKNLKPSYQKVLFGVVVIGLLVSLLQFWISYIGIYRSNYSWSWQYGYKEAVLFANKEADKYDRVVFTKKYGEPHEFFLFYSSYNPKQLMDSSNVIRYHRSDWFWVDRISKYEFINDWEIKEKLKDANSTLLVTSPGNYPEGSKYIKTIYFLNHDAAFDIMEL